MSFDKIYGYLITGLVGDAVGSPYEFRYGIKKYIDHCVTDSGFKAGQISDDGEMMIALLRGLIIGEGIWKEKFVVQEYIEWAGSDPIDIGLNTRNLFLQPLHNSIKAYKAAYNMFILQQPQDKWSQANGCLMRCMPLVLCTEKEVELDCMASNPHPVCIEACKLYHNLALNILKGNEIELETYLTSLKYDVNKQAVMDALGVKTLRYAGDRDVEKNRGWVCHALYFACVIYKFKTITPTEGLKWVIGKHLKSDTDTNAIISCSLIGLRHGYNKCVEMDTIFSENVNTVLNCNVNRPEKYHPKYLKDYCLKFLQYKGE